MIAISAACAYIQSHETVLHRDYFAKDMAAFEKGLPQGTRIYSYDEFWITVPGNAPAAQRTFYFPLSAKLTCDGENFELTNPVTGKTQTFPVTSKVTRVIGYREAAVKRGEAMTPALQQDVESGAAYYLKTL